MTHTPFAGGIEVRVSAYCPERSAVDPKKLRRWRWFWKWLGRPRPIGDRVMYMVDNILTVHPNTFATMLGSGAIEWRDIA